MSVFNYSVRNAAGKLEKGTMEAVSEDEVISALQDQGMLVVSISEKKGTAAAQKKETRRRLHGRCKLDDMILFAKQLAIMLEAGVSLIKALSILMEQVESRRLLRAVEKIKDDVETGQSLRDALSRHPRIFNSFWINLVETGETSGQLPLSLTQISKYLEASYGIRRRVKAAMIYPSVLIFVAITAIIIFVVKIVPTFAEIFSGFGAELPPLTQFVVDLSNGTKKYFLHGIVGIVLFVFVLKAIIRTRIGRFAFDKFMLNAPLLGKMNRLICIARFTRGLGTLIVSGVPIVRALEIIVKAVGNTVMEKSLEEVRLGVQEGKTVTEPLVATDMFPPIVTGMIAVGEETGELGGMLEKSSEFIEERVDAAVERLTTLFEPIILLIMGGIIGFFVVAMFLPVFSMSEVVGGM